MATDQAPACSSATLQFIPGQHLQNDQLIEPLGQDSHDIHISSSKWEGVEPINAQLQPKETMSALPNVPQHQLGRATPACAQQRSSGATTMASHTGAEVARSHARRALLNHVLPSQQPVAQVGAEGASRQTETVHQRQTDIQRPYTVEQLKAPQNVGSCKAQVLTQQHSPAEHRRAHHVFQIAAGDSDIPFLMQTGELDCLDYNCSVECSAVHAKMHLQWALV